MPYNFDTTFTRPIVAKLDAGKISGAKDWADAITDAYIATIKTGLPQGVPITLPAPGLNPTTPPPFNIGADGFKTAQTRRKNMHTIIYAYFRAKELKLDRASIEGMITDISQLMRKLRAKTQQVKTILQQIQLIQRELAELPTLLADIVRGVQEELDFLVDSAKDIDIVLNNARIRLGPEDYNRIFADEINLYNLLKDFQATDISGLQNIIRYLDAFDRGLGVLGGDSDSETKRYVRNKLMGIARTFIQFAEGVVDPTKILDLVNQIVRDTGRAKALYARLQKFDTFQRFVRPKLLKLTTRRDNLQREIRLNIQKRLVDQRKRVSDKIAEFTKNKQTSKSVALYQQATKIANEKKKVLQTKIRKLRKKVKLLKKALTLTEAITTQTQILIGGLESEFDKIVLEIEEQKRSVAQATSFDPTTIAVNAGEVLRPVTRTPINTNAPTFVGINFNNADTKITEVERRAAENKRQIARLKQYFEGLGLGGYFNLGALVITQTNCNFDTFKRFFEDRRSTIQIYAKKLESILLSIDDLVATLQELTTGTRPENQRSSTSWASDRLSSLKQLFSYVEEKLKAKTDRIKKWVRKQIEEIELYIKRVLKKAQEDIEKYIDNCKPLQSFIQDVKDLQIELEAKKRAIEEKVKKAKKYLLMASYIAKIARGASRLSGNIARKQYRLSSNRSAIDMILDGYYGYKGVDQPQSVLDSLASEKQKRRTNFKSLLVIEILSFALIEAFKDMSSSECIEELANIVKESPVDGVKPPGIEFVQTLLEIATNPPTTIPQTITLVENLNRLALNRRVGITVATKLLDVERRFLQRSRVIISTACDIPDIQGTRFEAVLRKVKNELDKNQSFILLAVGVLVSVISELAVFIFSFINKFLEQVRKKIREKLSKLSFDLRVATKKEVDKQVNLEAPIMSFTFGLAALLFWTGATWVGPTGTTHTCLTIGRFNNIKAKSTEGASEMMSQIATSFEGQLGRMRGIISPPPITGIPQSFFNGYK